MLHLTQSVCDFEEYVTEEGIFNLSKIKKKIKLTGGLLHLRWNSDSNKRYGTKCPFEALWQPQRNSCFKM
jgi:hypothetical protein